MIGKVVKARLKADPAGRGFVGGRVRPVQLCPGDELPALTYHVPSDEPDDQLDGPSGLVDYTVELRCLAWNYGQVRGLATAARKALVPIKEIIEGVNVRASFHRGGSDFPGKPQFSKTDKAPLEVRVLIGFWVREDKPDPIVT